MREGTGRLALVCCVGLIALALAGGAGSASATDTCAAVENETIVVTTPPSEQPAGPNDTLSVYPGSEVVVHLCQPEDGTRTLRSDGPTWATVVDESTHRLRLRVETAPDGSLGTLVADSAVPGPELRIAGRSVESDLIDGTIPVASEAGATALLEAEERFLERERTLEARLADLAAATNRVENGAEPNGTSIRRVAVANAAYHNATDALRSELYATAESSVGDASTSSAIVALDADATAMENRTRAGLASHGDALADRERSLTWALRLRIVGIGLLGVAIGALAGAVLPTRRGREARHRLAAGKWTTYSRRAVLLPTIVGVLLCCAGLWWLATNAGGALTEVLVP